MTKKQIKHPVSSLEKILSFAGLAVIILGCIANLYGAFVNRRFIYDFIDPLYYFQYIIILGGGFLAGYLAVNKSTTTRQSRLFLGVAYAALAMAVYWLSDLLRLVLQNVIGIPSYPWGKVVFEGTPLAATVVTLIVAYISQHRPNRIAPSVQVKGLLVGSFFISFIYSIVSQLHSLSSGAAKLDPNTPVWLNILGYVLSPIVIAIVGYLFLSPIEKRFDRLFYAVLIASLYNTLGTVLWELRTDATYNATNIFSYAVAVVSVVFVAGLLWRARRAIR